jgi:hypothetical protein
MDGLRRRLGGEDVDPAPASLPLAMAAGMAAMSTTALAVLVADPGRLLGRAFMMCCVSGVSRQWHGRKRLGQQILQPPRRPQGFVSHPACGS